MGGEASWGGEPGEEFPKVIGNLEGAGGAKGNFAGSGISNHDFDGAIVTGFTDR